MACAKSLKHSSDTPLFAGKLHKALRGVVIFLEPETRGEHAPSLQPHVVSDPRDPLDPARKLNRPADVSR